ncbi:uncharacterized protein J8A68_003805 [[Candida] subhashii]|uniref:Uncharacterized protein n=1 Tax=[Candida] subhashii TaxID=561895 RepID=A0A8J5UW29_9ASCO|nr:uncharacterized protein J8A68_003805 [[Candida] subhashii]KAG7662675.1 hypothetical protein J8A68_003805 [[Candida] subhashii]
MMSTMQIDSLESAPKRQKLQEQQDQAEQMSNYLEKHHNQPHHHHHHHHRSPHHTHHSMSPTVSEEHYIHKPHHHQHHRSITPEGKGQYHHGPTHDVAVNATSFGILTPISHSQSYEYLMNDNDTHLHPVEQHKMVDFSMLTEDHFTNKPQALHHNEEMQSMSGLPPQPYQQQQQMQSMSMAQESSSDYECPCGHLHGPGQGNHHDITCVGLSDHPLLIGPE